MFFTVKYMFTCSGHGISAIGTNRPELFSDAV